MNTIYTKPYSFFLKLSRNATRKLKVLPFCFLITTITNSSFALPTGLYILGNISIKDDDRLSEDEKKLIEEISLLHSGQTILLPKDKKLKEAVENLYKKGYAVVIIPNRAGETNVINLEIIILQKNPKLEKINWDGFSEKEVNEISKDIINFKVGTYIIYSRLDSLKKQIVNFFIKKGYLDIELKIKAEKINEESIIVDIILNRGTMYYLNKVELEVDSKTEPSYLSFLPYSSGGIWLNKSSKNFLDLISQLNRSFKRLIISPPPFVESKVEEDINVLKMHYQSLGYGDVSISQKMLVEGNKVSVFFKVSKGSIYNIGKINLIGNSLYTKEELEQIIGLHTGMVYNPFSFFENEIMEKKEILSNLYWEDFKKNVDLQIVTTKLENKKVEIDIYIEEASPQLIEEVNIHSQKNNYSELISYILKQHNLEKGAPFSPSQIKKCESILYELNLFKEGSISFKNSKKNNGRIVVDCYLNNKLTLSSGAQISNSTLHISGGVTHLPLYKITKGIIPLYFMRKVEGDLFLTWNKYPRGTISWVEPYILIKNKPFRLSIKGKSRLLGKRGTHRGCSIIIESKELQNPTSYSLEASLEKRSFNFNNIIHFSGVIERFIINFFWQYDSRVIENKPHNKDQNSHITCKINNKLFLPIKTNTPVLQTKVTIDKTIEVDKSHSLFIYGSLSSGITIGGWETPFYNFVQNQQKTKPQKEFCALLNPETIPFRGVPEESSFCSIPGSRSFLSTTLELRWLVESIKFSIFVDLLYYIAKKTGAKFFKTIGVEIKIPTPLGQISLYIGLPCCIGIRAGK